jgi:hypothetical protein
MKRYPHVPGECATLNSNHLPDGTSAYKNHHKHYPARVIVLKTSQFREEEAEGIFEAIDEAGPELRDLVWVQESYSVKVLRDGNYPVMRGTFVELDGKGLLYTNGSIPYYGTYPGLYESVAALPV